jgi:hypothetical protein
VARIEDYSESFFAVFQWTRGGGNKNGGQGKKSQNDAFAAFCG